MPVTTTGSLLTVNTVADSGSTSITVPADADAIVVGIAGYENSGPGSVANKLDGAVITLGGQQLTFITGVISNPGGDLSGMYGRTQLPGTGSQTLSWNWEGSSSWDEGGTLLVRFLKGVDQTEVNPCRDWDQAGTVGATSPQSVLTNEIDAEPGDYAVAVCGAWSSTLGSFTWTNLTEVYDATHNSFREGWAEAEPIEPDQYGATYTASGSGDRTVALCVGVIRAAPTGDDDAPDAFEGVVAATSDFAFGDFGAVSQQFQRRVFSDKKRGHDYLMFQDEDAAWLTMSPDNGQTWTTPHKLFDMPTDASLSLTTSIAYTAMHWDQDHEKLHVCWGFVGDDNPTHLKYRRGTLVGDGTVSWDAAAQNAFTGQGSLLEMSISTDSDGVPWITFEFFNDGSPPDHPKPWVVKNSGANATWTTASGFPFKLSDDNSHWWTGVGRANDSGGMWVFYWNDRYFMEGDVGSRSWAFARLWLPSGGWQTEIEIDLDRADITGQGSLPDVCYATDPDSGIAYFAWNDTFDAPKFWRSNEGVTYDMPPVYPETMAMGVDKATGHVYLVTQDPFNMSLDYWWFDSSLGYWEQGNVPLNVNFPLHSSMSITEYSDRILVAIQDMAFTGDHDIRVACVLAGADEREEDPGGTTYPQELTVTVVNASTLARRSGKIIIDTGTGSAAIQRLVSKLLAEDAQSVVSVPRHAGVTYTTTGAAEPSRVVHVEREPDSVTVEGSAGAETLKFIGRLITLTATSTVSLGRRVTKAFARQASGASALIRSSSKTVVAEALGVADLVTRRVRLLLASTAVSASSALVKGVRSMRATVAQVATQTVRGVARTITATAASAVSTAAQKLGGLVNLLLTASAVGQTAAVRDTRKTASLSAEGTGLLVRDVDKSTNAVGRVEPTLARRGLRTLRASVAGSPSHDRLILKRIERAVQTSVSVVRGVGAAVSIAASAAARLTRRMPVTLATSVVAAASFTSRRVTLVVLSTSAKVGASVEPVIARFTGAVSTFSLVRALTRVASGLRSGVVTADSERIVAVPKNLSHTLMISSPRIEVEEVDPYTFILTTHSDFEIRRVDL